MKIAEAIAHCPVVAILRGVAPEEAIDHVGALFEAGVRGAEIPLNSPDPLESLRRLVAEFGSGMAIGAGTVLNSDQVDAVAKAGGQFVVSPNTDADVIRRAVAVGVDPTPGFATASEAFQALAAGARHLKLFPAVTYGAGHLKQLKAVLPPEAVVWAVGGVGPNSISDWWHAGARAFGLGGELYRAGQTVEETRAKAMRMIAAVRRLVL